MEHMYRAKSREPNALHSSLFNSQIKRNCSTQRRIELGQSKEKQWSLCPLTKDGVVCRARFHHPCLIIYKPLTPNIVKYQDDVDMLRSCSTSSHVLRTESESPIGQSTRRVTQSSSGASLYSTTHTHTQLQCLLKPKQHFLCCYSTRYCSNHFPMKTIPRSILMIMILSLTISIFLT